MMCCYCKNIKQGDYFILCVDCLEETYDIVKKDIVECLTDDDREYINRYLFLLHTKDKKNVISDIRTFYVHGKSLLQLNIFGYKMTIALECDEQLKNFMFCGYIYSSTNMLEKICEKLELPDKNKMYLTIDNLFCLHKRIFSHFFLNDNMLVYQDIF